MFGFVRLQLCINLLYIIVTKGTQVHVQSVCVIINIVHNKLSTNEMENT